MRSLFYPLLTLIVVLVALGAALLLRPQDWWPEGPRNVSQLLEMASPAKPVAAAKPRASTTEPPATKSRIGTKGLAKGMQTEQIGPESSGAEVSALRPLPEKKYPFPLAERIVAGTPQTTILASFGRPEVKVTGAETGELRERYVYVDRATGRKTYIAMVNAVVTGVQTFSP